MASGIWQRSEKSSEGFERKARALWVLDDAAQFLRAICKAMTPAKVRYIGSAGGRRKNFTTGNLYDAFFVEYWEGVRNSLHVSDDAGKIVDFVPLEEFEITSDPDGLLEMKEARVRCVTRRLDDCLFGVRFGREYAAIGRDRDGFYLVKDETERCYFYPPTDFEIISDPEGILARRSVYYNYFRGRPASASSEGV